MSQRILDSLETIRLNPGAVQRLILQDLEDSLGKKYALAEANNPVVFVMEQAVFLSTAAMQQAETLTRKQFPSLAASWNDLYAHVSDVDTVGSFATPGKVKLIVYLPLDEIKTKAVTVANSNGLRMLTIPRHTEITVGEHSFTMQYPINIRLYRHGTISVIADTTSPSPLQTLDSNFLQYWQANIGAEPFLAIEIPILQMKLTQTSINLTSVSGFKKDVVFNDKYVYTRAFIRSDNETTWQEIYTTLSDMVYDPAKPTVALKVSPGNLQVTIPQIYFNNGLIKDNIRLDVYTTKGNSNLVLSNFQRTAFKYKWLDYDADNKNAFSAPLDNFTKLIVVSDDTVTGGVDGRTFAEQRERVIHRDAITEGLPITPRQLSSKITDLGFSKVTNLDNVTDRDYLATRLLEAPTDGSTVTGAGATIITHSISLRELASAKTVRDNGNRLTVLPNTLYQLNNGLLEIIDKDVVDVLRKPQFTTPDALTNIVNNSSFYYSPFFYVHNQDNSEYSVRPYRLDSPTITSRNYVGDNPGLLLNANSINHELRILPDYSGYSLWVELEANDAFKQLSPDQVHCQLSYKDPSGNNRLWVTGTMVNAIDATTGKPVNNRYVYRFDLLTNWDVDDNHCLFFNSTVMAVPLKADFDFVVVVKNHLPPDATLTDIDSNFKASLLNGFDYQATYVGLTHEKLSIEFGTYMKHLWQSCRSSITSDMYKVYDSDVQAVYADNVYETDQNGNIAINWNSELNKLEYTILHHKGDLRTDEFGNPIYAHRAGDIFLDEFGQPVIIGGEKSILRLFDIFLVDGKYYFTTADSSIDYRTKFVDDIVNWSEIQLASLSKQLLERTNLYFYPKSTVGYLSVLADDGAIVNVPADQSFYIRYTVSEDVDKNTDLKATITATTAKVLLSTLRASTTRSHSDLVDALKTAMGDDVMGIELTGFMNDLYKTISLVDQSMSPSIAKRLIASSNLTLSVEDDITVEFKRHGLSDA